MRFSHFFVDRPIFAAVISIIVTLVGYISYRTLPVTEYPEIAPPTVVVAASFAGASAEVIAETVASPIEQEINGVDDMLYMVSQSTGDGALSISVVFKPGTNVDQAQVLVQLAELDVLRSEGQALAAKLGSAGVEVDLEVFPGVLHGFMRSMATVGKARDAVEKAGAWLRETR